MKIHVAGLGAVGGLLAARLHAAGHEVTALARGRTLAAVREHGLRLRLSGEALTARFPVDDDAQAFGPQDVVLIALKGPALPDVATQLRPLIGPQTLIVPAMNGVPWWFLQTPELAARLGEANLALSSVDPQGRIAASLPLPQVLGCVVHLACSQPEPGVVQHGFGNRLLVGEPAGPVSERVRMVTHALQAAGFEAEASDAIRREIWFKLWGNLTMNPVSALTGATADLILDDPLVRGFMLQAMAEAAQIGDRIGCPITQSGEARLDVARQLGAFKTSMLQDSEAGRPLEIDAIVTAVHEIGGKLGLATPNIDALLGLVRLMAQTRGLYLRPAG